MLWLTDTISGAKDNRPELDKILYHTDQLPPHDAVIVFKNDRVARDTKLYFYYFYTLEKRNVSPQISVSDIPSPCARKTSSTIGLSSGQIVSTPSTA